MIGGRAVGRSRNRAVSTCHRCRSLITRSETLPLANRAIVVGFQPKRLRLDMTYPQVPPADRRGFRSTPSRMRSRTIKPMPHTEGLPLRTLIDVLLRIG